MTTKTQKTKSSKTRRKTGWAYFLGIIGIVALLAVTALLILEFCTSYKPSNGFKKIVLESEKTEKLPAASACIFSDNDTDDDGIAPYAAVITCPDCGGTARKVTKNPTCTASGSEYTQCNSCGHKWGETTKPALGHNYTSWTVTTAATCVTAGVETKCCSRCRVLTNETRTIPATGHSYSEWTVTTAATCVTAGVETKTCSACSASETRTIPATGHNCTWQTVSDPSGTTAGVEKYVCSTCNQITDSRLILPDDPVEEGHTFVGWYLDEELTQPYSGGSYSEGIELYAKYEVNRFTVTFDSDGGSAVESQTVDWNTAATLPESVRTGHTLMGWFLSDGTQYINQAIKEDTALTAHWQINTYTLTLNGNGGEIAKDTVSGEYNTVPTIPTPTRTGYTFTGWKTDEGLIYNIFTPLTKDMTLIAQWAEASAEEPGKETETVKRSVFTIKNTLSSGDYLSGYQYLNNHKDQFTHFEYVVGLPSRNSTGETGESSLGFSSETESGVFYLLEYVCRYNTTGSSLFLGFGLEMSSEYQERTYPTYDGSATDGLYITITDERAFISYFPSYTDVSEKGEYQDSLSKTIAVFEKGTSEYDGFYKVLLGSKCAVNGRSGNGSTSSELNNVYESMTLFNYEEVPKKDGYTFIGWFYDEECTQKYGGETVGSDVTLYPGYEINKYTVSYYANVGNVINPNEAGLYDRVDTVEYGSIANYIPPTVEGSVFLGWYFDDGTKYENAPVVQDIALYGKWQNTFYSIVLDYSGGNSEYGTEFLVERGTMFSPPTAVKEGCTLIGWENISDSILGEMYIDGAVYSDLRLRAIWRDIYYTVDFYVDGEVYAQKFFRYGTTAFECPVDKEGYTLTGLYVGNIHGENCAEYDYSPLQDNIVLHAHFKIAEYTVNFMVDGKVYYTATVGHGLELSALVNWANDRGLRVNSFRSAENNELLTSDIIIGDTSVETEPMTGSVKFSYFVKENKWAVLGVTAGVVVTVVVIAVVCGVKRRRRTR